MATPQFLEKPEVLHFHELAIQGYGGLDGIRDDGLLDSALAQPRQSFGGSFLHAFPFEMASAYGYHLCLNHPFFDGNKRVAWVAIRSFLFENGFSLRVGTEDAVAMMMAVAEGKVEKAALAAWLAARARPRPTLELREFFKRLDFDELMRRMPTLLASNWHGDHAALRQETAMAIPVFDRLLAEGLADPENKRPMVDMAFLLCAIYRLAEDQGYEW